MEDDRLALLEHRLSRLKHKLQKQQQQILDFVRIGQRNCVDGDDSEECFSKVPTTIRKNY